MSTLYPGSLDSFTTKQDGAGNLIMAAHVNDVQDSIVAIETELKVNHNSNLDVHPLVFAPTSDHTASGSKTTMTFGESIVFGQLCYHNSDNTLHLANANAELTMPGIVLALESGTAGLSKKVLLNGFIRDDSWSWTLGGSAGLIYASTTPGALSQSPPVTAGHQAQIIGIALSGNVIYFNPNLILIEIS